MFIISLALGSFTFGLGGLITDIIFAIIYNKLYIKDLLEKNYLPADEQAEATLHSMGIIS